MRRQKIGYTLLEIVVYVSILAVIAVIVLETFLSMYKSFGKTRIERRVTMNGDVAMETMVREIRTATSTNADASSFGVNPGTLVLSHGKRFYSSAGALMAQDGTGPAAKLTSSEITINNLIFYRATSTNSDIIKIEMTVKSGDGIFFTQKNFFGSAVTRGSY